MKFELRREIVGLLREGRRSVTTTTAEGKTMKTVIRNYVKLDGRWIRPYYRSLASLTRYLDAERWSVDANGYQLDRLSPRKRGRGMRPDGLNFSLVF